ncbi:MAG: alkyl hydroperoxide reductase/Thiol specific antioxidant/Mal allergen [Bacteroidetes bacterium]|nr:alkyl hydroperoxide reductase/Thiol specific antioxidant/Mal allergen [Bacteroidota bacterium]
MIAMAVFTASAGMPVPSAPEIGKPAPGFTLTDITGASHQLSDFKGKTVVLEWTNPNCPFVQRVYRDGIMTAVQKEYAQKGVVWLVVNSTNTNHRDFLAPEVLKEKFASWKAGFTALLMDSEMPRPRRTCLSSTRMAHLCTTAPSTTTRAVKMTRSSITSAPS